MRKHLRVVGTVFAIWRRSPRHWSAYGMGWTLNRIGDAIGRAGARIMKWAITRLSKAAAPNREPV